MPEEHPLLEDLARSARREYMAHRWEGDFQAYLREKVEKDPYRYTRTAFQFLRDMMDHFGTAVVEDAGEKFLRYRLFDDPFHAGQKAVHGVQRTMARLAAFIRAAAREEGKERIFVLVGPVGTAKTTIVDLIGRGLEVYSATPEGEVFAIAWQFPRSLEDAEAGLGFVRTGPDREGQVFARVPCQMHDNPLFLIPRAERREYLKGLFGRVYPDPARRPPIPRKILEGELCYNCSQIYDYLMKRHEGDWNQVIRRVVVEQFLFSELKGAGIGKVQPEGNVESSSTYVAFDENYKALSMLLAEVNLVKFNGKYVMANRGLMHYSDIFKRPVNYLQHLLSAVEEHRVDFGEVGADIDVVLVGTTNTPEYMAFRENPMSRGIQSRLRRIDVPYLLNYHDEEKIYGQGLLEVSRARHVAPHTTNFAALWAVLTRLVRSSLSDDEELTLSERQAVKALTPVEKALVYAGEVPPTLSHEAREAFSKELVRKLRNEYPQEGMEGVSPRIVQNVFADLCETSDDRCVTPIEVFRKMRWMLEEGTEIREHLTMEADGEYGDPDRHLQSVVERWQGIVKSEVESALIDVAPQELDAKIRFYLQHVTAHLKKEKLPGPHGRAAEPDEALMRFVEGKMGVADDEREDFRFKILARATSAAKDGAALDIPEIYKDLYRSVLQGLYEERRRRIHWPSLRLALDKIDRPGEFAQLDEWTRRVAETLTRNMKERCGYCVRCAKSVTFYVLDNRLIET